MPAPSRPAGPAARLPDLGAVRRAAGRWTEGSRARLRARRVRSQLEPVLSRGSLEDARIVLVSVIRDDAPRLPYWLRYYRDIGVDHFVIVDNGSTDDTLQHLESLPSATVLRTEQSFRAARFGMDWVDAVAGAHCRGKWVLHVDSDEFLSFDGVETGGLPRLVETLEARRLRSLQCLLLDVYSTRPVRENVVVPGQDPFEVCDRFDATGYLRRYDRALRTTWITGGVRGRLFFGTDPVGSPALNKTPLVHWDSRTAYVQSGHRLAPAALNDQSISAGITGVLLHQRFLADNARKAADPAHVEQHNPEYAKYGRFGDVSPFSADVSRRFRSSADLVDSGLATRIG